MVEQLGSGVLRILESYKRECFTFTDNFLRMTFPIIGGQVGGQVGFLTKRQREILELIIKDPAISRKTLRMITKPIISHIAFRILHFAYCEITQKRLTLRKKRS